MGKPLKGRGDRSANHLQGLHGHVMRVRRALDETGAKALGLLAEQFDGIDVAVIARALRGVMLGASAGAQAGTSILQRDAPQPRQRVLHSGRVRAAMLEHLQNRKAVEHLVLLAQLGDLRESSLLLS